MHPTVTARSPYFCYILMNAGFFENTPVNTAAAISAFLQSHYPMAGEWLCHPHPCLQLPLGKTELETPGTASWALPLPARGTAGRGVWANLWCPRETSAQQGWQGLPATVSTSRHWGFLCFRFLPSLHNSVLFLRHGSQQRFHLKQPQLPPQQCQAWGHTRPRLLHKAHSQGTGSLLSKGLKLGLLHIFPSARLTPAAVVNWLQSYLKSSGERKLHNK